MESFDHLQTMLSSPYYKLVLWVFSSAFLYHVLAGMRHMLMDIGWGEGLGAGRQSAKIVIVFATILTIFLGIWIW